jgi:hypothetical protein
MHARSGADLAVSRADVASLRLNPHPRRRRECGTLKFNDVRFGGAKGWATHLFERSTVTAHYRSSGEHRIIGSTVIRSPFSMGALRIYESRSSRRRD